MRLVFVLGGRVFFRFVDGVVRALDAGGHQVELGTISLDTAIMDKGLEATIIADTADRGIFSRERGVEIISESF